MLELSSEASLLAHLIVHNENAQKVRARVPEGAFLNPKHALIYAAILRCIDKYKKADLVLVKEELGPALLEAGGLSYLATLFNNAPDKDLWEPYAEHVLSAWRSSLLRSSCLAVAEGLERGDSLSSALGRLHQSMRPVAPEEKDAFGDLLATSMQGLEAARKSGPCLFFGYGAIDQAVGGMRPGKLYLVGGKTSHGKTAFAINVVHNNLKSRPDLKVLYNAFEDVDQISSRMTAIEHRIPLAWFRQPDQLADADWEALRQKTQDLSKYNDRFRVLMGATNARMREVIEAMRPDLVVVDYIQRYAHKYAVAEDGRLSHEIGKLASDLQDMALTYKCSVMVLSQFGRRQEEHRFRRPTLNDFKESGDLENIADVALLLWWKYRDSSKEDPNDYTVLVEKNKLGPCAEANLWLDLETLRLTNTSKG